MKIGLVRHFKVDSCAKMIMNSDEFEEYVKNYDEADVIKNKVCIDENEWDKCYCSDMPRAQKTAESIYRGSIIKSSLLREVAMYPVIKSKIKVPSFFWSISARIAWKLNNKSQLETLKYTKERAEEFVRNISFDGDENILIVSHGFFFITLIDELKRLGFKGSIPRKMKNGTIYILEN